MLFARTTRRVELSPAGSVLVARLRRALAEIDGAIADARQSAQQDPTVLAIGHGPFSRPLALRIVDEVRVQRPELSVRLDENLTPELLRRMTEGEVKAAVVQETPAAAQRQAYPY